MMSNPRKGTSEDWEVQLQDMLLYQAQFTILMSMVVFMYAMRMPGRDAVEDIQWKRSLSIVMLVTLIIAAILETSA